MAYQLIFGLWEYYSFLCFLHSTLLKVTTWKQTYIEDAILYLTYNQLYPKSRRLNRQAQMYKISLENFLLLILKNDYNLLI